MLNAVTLVWGSLRLAPTRYLHANISRLKSVYWDHRTTEIYTGTMYDFKVISNCPGLQLDILIPYCTRWSAVFYECVLCRVAGLSWCHTLTHWQNTILLCMCQLWHLKKILHDVTVPLTIKITALVAHWHSDSCTSCSVSYQTIPQHWCRKNTIGTGKGSDYKCFGPCGMCWRAAWR